MIKVLLLDDEKLALEYLETIVDWQGLGFRVIGQCTDAKQALRLFRREKPELIISDVCMVGMDGIDFVTSVREADQSVHILFLSGYKNFEYVQSAIRLGIDDYLLKSDVNDQIFLKKLIQIKEKIVKEQQKARYTVNTMLREIFEQDVDEKGYRDILNEEQYSRLQKGYYYLVSAVKHCPAFIAEHLPEMNKNCYLDEGIVAAALAEAGKNEGIRDVTSFMLDDWHMLSILDVLTDVDSHYGNAEKIRKVAEYISTRLNALSMQAFDFFYTTECFTVREFGQIYERTKVQLNQQYLDKNRGIFVYKLKVQEKGVVPGSSRKLCDKICAAVEKVDKAYLDNWLLEVRSALAQRRSDEYLKMIQAAFEAFARIEEEWSQNLSGCYFSIMERSGDFDFLDAEKVIQFVTVKMEAALNLYQRDQKVHYSRSIQDAINCIQNNYGEEAMGVSMIAKCVNLTPSWLSTKFKEEVGMGISEYLNSVRIQHARELLQSGDCMIYEVSERTGFASSQYFSKIFKQLTGMTPNEYRRKSKNIKRK